jgi:hypothetical protein
MQIRRSIAHAEIPAKNNILSVTGIICLISPEDIFISVTRTRFSLGHRSKHKKENCGTSLFRT